MNTSFLRREASQRIGLYQRCRGKGQRVGDPALRERHGLIEGSHTARIRLLLPETLSNTCPDAGVIGVGRETLAFALAVHLDGIAGSFVLHYADRMARPRGRTKPARLTVNLDRPTYCALNELAQREDVSVSWVIRRAIEALLIQDQATSIGPTVGASKHQIDQTPASETASR